jgi:hypothetical protein
MAASQTTVWMKRNHLKSVTVYFAESIFERIKAAAKEDRTSKSTWLHNIVIERLRKSGGQ